MVGLIVAALAAGARLGPAEAGAAQLREASARLWTLARKRLAGYPDGVTMLTRHAEAPRTWEGPLSTALLAVGAADDQELLTAAAALLRLAGGPRQGEVDLRTAMTRRSR